MLPSLTIKAIKRHSRNTLGNKGREISYNEIYEDFGQGLANSPRPQTHALPCYIHSCDMKAPSYGSYFSKSVNVH